MTCYHPLKGFKIGFNPDTNKPIYKIVPYTVDYIIIEDGKTIYKQGIPDDWVKTFPNVYTEFVQIPCGKCIGCKLKYSEDWANRCMLEAKEWPSNYFLTLTYDDDHIPLEASYDALTGEIIETPSLKKSDLQKFFKRLRKNTGQHIRYYACGEYGDRTFRPHYHAIVFNLCLDDLVFLRDGATDGVKYYTSKTISDIWKNGHILVGEVTWQSCAYVARYVMKKRSGDEKSDFYSRYNIVSEYTVMSRKPGIGKNYYDLNFEDIYRFDELIYSTSNGSKVSKPPKYFDKLFEIDYPEKMENIKSNRKRMAERMQELKLERTSLSYQELLSIEENNKRTRILPLQRQL